MPRDLLQEFGVEPPPVSQAGGEVPAGRNLFQEFGIRPDGEAAPPGGQPSAGRDLLEEFGVAADAASSSAKGSPPAGRDLFQELGIEVEPGLIDKAKTLIATTGRVVAGAVKQGGRDIGNLLSPDQSVMKTVDVGRDLLAEFNLSDAGANRASPGDVAVARRLVEKINAEGRRRDIGTMKPEDRVTDAPFRKPLAPVRPEGVLPRVAKDVASGVTGLGAGFAGAAEWMTGAPSTAAAAKYLEAVTQNLTPDDPNFGDQLAAGAGSFAAFFLPGLGVAKGAEAIGKVSTVAANWLGAGSSAALEASAEAGSVFRDLRRQGRSVEQASRAATAVFWSNAALVGVTNKMGLFSEAGGAVRRGATAAETEGFQEGSQQAISNVATDRPVTEGVGTSAAIGTILGGGAGVVMGARSRPAPALDISDAEIIDQRTSTPVETSVPAGEPASAAAPIAQPPVAPAQPMVRPPSGSAVAPGPATATGADLFEQLGVTPPTMEQGAVDQAAHEAATSPQNALPEPTDAQKENGNYAKGHVRVGGLDISIENPIGSERSGTDPDGKPWSVTMAAHYGYVRRTEGKDGDQVDVYIAKGTPQDWDGPAFVVDQVNPSTGRFDEHKVILGVDAREEASKLYDAHFADASGLRRRRAITQIPMQEFKQWLKDGNLKAPAADQMSTMTPALDAYARNVPDAPTTSAAALPGNMPHAAAQTPDRAQPRSPGSASEAGNTLPIAARTHQDSSIDFSRIRAGQPLMNPRDGYGVSATGLPEGQYLVSPAGANVTKDRSAWPFQPFVTDENGVRAFASRSRATQAPTAGVDQTEAPDRRQTDTGGTQRVSRVDRRQDLAGRVDRSLELMRQAEADSKDLAAQLSAARDQGKDTTALTAQWKAAREEIGKHRQDATTLREGLESHRALASPPIDTPDPDLAATAVGRRAYAPAATATERADTDQARPDQIREAIRKLFNVPINEKHVTVRRASGIYKVRPQTIRVRNQNDLDVIAHEVGHHFSETKPRVRGLMKTHEAELLAITPDAYAKEPKALRREEGFAEFIRLYLTQKAEAQRLAPRFMKEFDAFIDDNPHYRAAFDQVSGMIDEWFKLDPVERIMAKVGGRPKSLTERLGENFGKDRLIFEALDNWHPLKLMVADLKPGIAAIEDPFKAGHLLSGDAAIIEDWLVSGTVPFDPALRADPANYGKPLHDILKPVAKQLRPFSAYLIAKRAQELKALGKENLFTDEEIKAGLELETPEFKAAATEVYAYQDRLLDYPVEGGFLSQEAADKFREYTAYIPFFRESEDGAGGQGASVFRRLTGGTSNLRDPISNIIQNTANIIHATNRNAVLAKAYQLAQSVPGGGRWIEAIPMPKKAVEVSTERILEQLKREGVKIDATLAQDLATMQTFFQRSMVGDRGNRTIIVKVDGEPKALQINNKMLWQALQAFEPLDLGLVGTMLAVPSDLLRAGVVLTPDFMGRNVMRDTLSGFIQSKHRLIPLVGTVGGFKEVVTRSDTAKLYRAFGGAYGDLWKGESEQTRKVLERMAKRGKFDPRTILTPSGIIDVLHRLGSISEAGTRVAEFKRTAKKGDINSLIDAAYNAREVSVDFGMHGHNQTIRMLTRITPFLNPAMQGFYKMGRTGREQFFTTMLRGSMLAAFSVALFLMNRDEDWYDEIENWEKNVYWHLDVGLLTEQGEVIPLRLPKPFEWGAVFGSVPEALAQVAIDLEGSKFAKRLGSILKDVFALRAVPTAVLVPTELWANKNTFTDRKIVSESKERLDPELQYGPGTSLTARAIGQATGTSPAKLDHMVRGFLGTMGAYGVMLSDQALRYAGNYPEPPATNWRRMPVIKAFVHDPDNPNSRYVNEFYELLDKARRAEASHKKYEGEAADAYYAKHKDAIDLAADANRTARDLADLRRDNEDITGSRDYTGQEKQHLIRDNSALIRQIAKEGVRSTRP